MIRLPALGHAYYRYAASALLASFAGGMQFVALSWFLFSYTGSAWSMGAAMIVSTLPGIMLSPWIGALVDRGDPRRICAWTDIVRGLMWAAAALSANIDTLVVPVLYAAIFISAICDCFFLPAIGAMIREIVPRERLLQANVVSNASMQIGVTLGGVLGGVLVAIVGAVGSVATISAAFVLSGALIMSIRTRVVPTLAAASGAEHRPSLLDDYRETLEYLRGRPVVIAFCAILVLTYGNMNFCNTVLPIFVARDLRASSFDFGLIDAFWGFGSIAGGFLLSTFAKRVMPIRVGIIGLVSMAASLTLLSTAVSPLNAAAVNFVMGSMNCMLRVNTDTALLHEAPPRLYGKLKSMTMMLIAMVSLFAYATVGAFGDAVSVRSFYRAVGAVLLLSVLVGGALFWRRRSDAPAGAVVPDAGAERLD